VSGAYTCTVSGSSGGTTCSGPSVLTWSGS
jgi:hypothetical protein